MRRLSLAVFVLSAAVSVFSQATLDWWESANFYQIYPRSFMDSDGDGVGDLKGIQSKLQYLKDLGVDGVWLSPIYKSPQADGGYDIADFRDIHNEYGTLEDFDNLLAATKAFGLKLILDFVPNHSSDEHEWFGKSERREPGFENYYIWHDGKIDPYTNLLVPPTNWRSFFRYSAWKYSNIRKQFYLHQFHYKQPDLNYRDPKLVQEMKDVLSFWMNRGVDGFRIDIIVCLFEKIVNGTWADEPKSNNPVCDSQDHCSLDHIYTQDQDETYDMAYQWRALLEDFKATNGGESKLMMTESYSDIDKVFKFYGNGQKDGSQIPFNFQIIMSKNANSTAREYKQTVEDWINKLPAGKRANWVLGNHDQHRAVSRLGVERGDLLTIMIQTLPGIAITYMGEELCMENVHVSWEDTKDPQACNTNPTYYHQNSRDPARTPFPWDGSKNAGFSTADKTWLPVGTNYLTNNVKAQQEAVNSHLKIFQKLLRLRKQSVLQYGNYEGKLDPNGNIYSFKRELVGTGTIVTALNFGNTQAIVNLKSLFPTIPSSMTVYTSSLNSGHTDGSTVETAKVTLKANHGIVLLTSSI